VTADHTAGEDFRLLTPEAFDFVLSNELKRAVRSQNFLTLVVFDPHLEPSGVQGVREVARIVSREVRETDLLTASPDGRLSLVLLDADLQSSRRVIARVMSRLEHYQFTTPVDVEVGAASCPTQGSDPGTLRRAAAADAAASRGSQRGTGSNAQ
jgi:GGDEF domain-containing protein